MAHSVKVQLPAYEVGKSNVELSVSDDNGKVGTLLVSKGAVVWRPKSGKKTYKMTWLQFDRLMRQGIKSDGE